MRIAFLGDTLLGGEAEATLERHGYEYAFAGLRPLLRGVDLLVVNHEGALTLLDRPHEKVDTGRKRYWYRSRPEAAHALRRLGVSVVSLGNNHSLDFGLRGLADTITALDAAGIAHCGAGEDEPQARRPALVSIGGHRIGFLSCMQRYEIYVRERLYASGSNGGCRRLRLGTIRADLSALQDLADFRVVLVHWGRNYRAVSRRQERLGTALIDAGADLVVGHHPHIPQRVELSAGRPIFYSLGNGLLGTPGRFHSGRPPYGMLAIVELDDAARLAAMELRLLAVDNARVAFSPTPADDPEARRFLRSLVPPDQIWKNERGGLRAEFEPAAR